MRSEVDVWLIDRLEKYEVELLEEIEKLTIEREVLKQKVEELEVDLEEWRNGIYAKLML